MTCGLHVVDPDDATAGGVPVGGVVDGPTAQVVRLLVSQVVPNKTNGCGLQNTNNLKQDELSQEIQSCFLRDFQEKMDDPILARGVRLMMKFK